jgi:hypothetical protein
MSSPVTREEFAELCNDLKGLTSAVNGLILEFKTSNQGNCKDIEFIKEKIEGLQDFKTAMYAKVDEHDKRISKIETSASAVKINHSTIISYVTFLTMLIGFVLKLAKVW